jgi:oligoribonuclease NrnB/cAMP/cGMP phosphodiesterase (DHH superfamily)
MRLVTRADFDGLVCAALLREAGVVDGFKFVHPKDVQDGQVEVDANDVLANVPFVEGAGMWFDHHISEAARIKEQELNLKGIKGAVKLAPSAARVIWEYYGGHKKFPEGFDSMLEGVDKVDSGNLSREDVLNPQGWVLLGFIMDPRTGLGRHDRFRVSNWELLTDLVEMCRTMSIDEILTRPDLQEREAFYREQAAAFEAMLRARSEQRGNVLVTDLRSVDEFAVGNRFMVYALYPECNVSMQLMWDHKKENVVITVGHSVLNKTCKANIGNLLLEYGGGGHRKVGTCQVFAPVADDTVQEIVQRLQQEC